MSEPKLNPEFAESLQTNTTDYDKKMRDRISIDVADMQIALETFKKVVISRNFATPVLGIVALWLPFVSSDFKPVGKLSADTVEGVYLGVVLCVTVAIVKSWIPPISSWKHGEFRNNTADPAVLAKRLHSRDEKN